MIRQTTYSKDAHDQFDAAPEARAFLKAYVAVRTAHDARDLQEEIVAQFSLDQHINAFFTAIEEKTILPENESWLRTEMDRAFAPRVTRLFDGTERPSERASESIAWWREAWIKKGRPNMRGYVQR